jgi:pyruvate dehydrogenase E1 component alpha subunit/2-oxoisovalerate dehydrogenase E1 component alpha subunit
MLKTAGRTVDSPTKAAPHPRFLEAFRWMLLARIFEEKLTSLYRGGQITGGVYVGRGQEAISAACGMFLQKGDVFAPLIRDQAGRSAFGEDLLDVARTYLGSRQGPMRGRDGNIHRGRPREGQLAMISHLGAMIPAVAGALFARKMKGETGAVGATCIGDGGTSTGAFHEGMNFAAVEKLPLVLVVANNQYAYSTPTSRQFVCEHLVDKAIGYGVRGHTVDGTNLEACIEVVGGAVDLARDGDGPQLVVASILRLGGHGEHDDAGYVDPKLKDSNLGQDCLKLAENFLLEQAWADSGDLDLWRSEATQQVEEAVATVQREPAPDPNEEDWCALATRHLSEGYAEE